MTRLEKIQLAIEKGYTCNPETGEVYGKKGVVKSKGSLGYLKIDFRYKGERLAKIVTPGNVSSASYIEIYSGWVIGDTFDWTGKTDRPVGVKITPIKGRMKHKLDFSQIFSATEDDNEDRGVPMILN